jgi:hypothetical protein
MIIYNDLGFCGSANRSLKSIFGNLGKKLQKATNIIVLKYFVGNCI